MPDITSISAMLTSLKTATDIAKALREAGHLPPKADEINRALAAIRALDPDRSYGLVWFET